MPRPSKMVRSDNFILVIKALKAPHRHEENAFGPATSRIEAPF
jgi:hypothetical protein